eukprot:CAMPEP_0173359438 /NCGR_PEP_ID=MMETSP1144-20121109/20039_1 /TAXON_ID=483371 /ORGANISM="non described non described, Strain CCMP2298" /LENGTH=37 /DNA_ID= /DNA_START= /DNA_END= /DNA_ORIENTATION=
MAERAPAQEGVIGRIGRRAHGGRYRLQAGPASVSQAF